MLKSSACLYCKNFVNDKKFTCKAFPKGIPREIYFNELINPHPSEMKNQTGKFIFEPNDYFFKLYSEEWGKGGKIPF
jgi:hypothetical protein